MKDEKNKIIYSFFWLATEKTQMKKVNQENKWKCIDPDGEQLLFWKVVLGGDPQMELTFQIAPFVRFEAWDELLDDISQMGEEEISGCLKDNLKGGDLDKQLSLVPAIFGINSCYESQERKSAVRFSLLGCCDGKILERILLIILEALFVGCHDRQMNKSVKRIMDDFISGLVNEYPVSEELNGCILRRYEKIRDRLKECFPEEAYNLKYERLQKEWESIVEEAQDCDDVMEYYDKVFPGNRNTVYLLYLIQEICKAAGCPCAFPPEFSEEELQRKVGLMPEAIRNMRTLYDEILHMNHLEKQKEIVDEIVGHIHSRHMDWDRGVIKELVDKAKEDH